MRFISRCLARTFEVSNEGFKEASEKLLKMVEEIEASLQ